MEEILRTKFNHQVYIASFDVQSSFTNISLLETIEICVNLAEQDKLIPHNLSKKDFNALLYLAVK